MNKVDDFWRGMERTIRSCLAFVGINGDDADYVAADMMRRLRGIPVALPMEAGNTFFAGLAACLLDLVIAEKRLIAAHEGVAPGYPIRDWTPRPILYDHPFLMAVQAIVGQIQAEANKGKYKRSAN